MSRSSANRVRASSRDRNDNARFGFQPSILAKWRHDRLERDIASGLWSGLHKGMLATKIIFMGGTKVNTPVPQTPLVTKLKKMVGMG